MNIIEPVHRALQQNDTQLLFETLGIKRYPVDTKNKKRDWVIFKDELSAARNNSVIQMIGIAIHSKLIPVPQAVLSFYKNATEAANMPYRNGTISELANLNYVEFIHAIEFLRPSSIYSTNHGVKGEEFDNVVFVIGRGWNHYNFEKYMSMNPDSITVDDQSAYERNRNLFYVCCSRSKRRLILFITTPFGGCFKEYLENLIGKNKIFSYSQYLNINVQ